MGRQFTCFVLIGGFALLPAPVHSQQNYEWFQTEVNSYAGGAAVHPGEDCFENGFIVDVRGPTAYLRSTIDGSVHGSYSTGGGTFNPIIENKPTIAKLKDGKWYAFVASSDGKLYKLDVAGSLGLAVTQPFHPQIVSIRRLGDSGCTEKDKITASPVVQLESASNNGYTLGRDIVLVATHHGCSSSSTNMVYAFDAADITLPPIWVFNEFADYAVDYFTNCILDINRNTIFCCTNLIAGHTQNTIWSLNTVTGNINWASNFNYIHSSPLLGNSVAGGIDHLYAIDIFTKLHAINPGTGIEDWNLTLSNTPGVFADQPLKVGQGDFAQVIMTTITDGKMLAIYDGGTNPTDAEILWQYVPVGGAKVKTTCTPMGSSGKCYAGLDDGTIHQFNMALGTSEATQKIFGSILPASSLNFADLEIYNQGGYEYKMILTAWGYDGVVAQYHIPSFTEDGPFNTWTGKYSSAWENPGNWSYLRVPDATTDVVIGCGIVVVASVNAVCRNLDVRSGSILIVNPGSKITLTY